MNENSSERIFKELQQPSEAQLRMANRQSQEAFYLHSLVPREATISPHGSKGDQENPRSPCDHLCHVRILHSFHGLIAHFV